MSRQEHGASAQGPTVATQQSPSPSGLGPSGECQLAGHTPGPWHVEPVCGEDDQQFFSDDWNGTVWCVCHPQTVCDATTVVDWINEADAHLIAAAPELLQQCRAALEWFDRNYCGGGVSDDLRAAITKATKP